MEEQSTVDLRSYARIFQFVFFSIVWTMACALLNLLGLLATQLLGHSVLFLDMVGTAFASLSRGIGYGVVVALTSNFLGQFIPDTWFPGTYDPQAYKWFALANAAGAVSWAVLPRLRVIAPRPFAWLPSRDLFSTEPTFGYRALLLHVTIIGAVTGTIVALVGFIVQQWVLDCGRFPEICSHASITASTSSTIDDAIGARIGSDSLARLATLEVINVLDKVLTTAIALVLVLSWTHVPNYIAQATHLKEAQERYTKSRIRITATVLYAFFWTLFLVLYIDAPPPWAQQNRAVLVSVAIFLMLLIPLVTRDRIPLYNVFYKSHVKAHKMFQDKDELRGQSFQRDVLEDLFKTATILLAVAELLLSQSPAEYRLVSLARTVIFLQLLRYLVVFLMRVSGKFDQKSRTAT